MIHDSRQRTRVSKFISLILRHEPKKFGVELDRHGFTDIDSVVDAVRRHFPDFTLEDLQTIAAEDAKGRFHIVDERIRARYGHSIYVEPNVEPAQPPELLYHGTAEEKIAVIMEQGLRPMNRRFVHFSPTIDEARTVGRRHSRNVVILKVHARDAYLAGIPFYAEHGIYLAEYIPADFIENPQ